MRTIGRLTTVLAIAALGWLAAQGVRSIPDIKRYIEIRRM